MLRSAPLVRFTGAATGAPLLRKAAPQLRAAHMSEAILNPTHTSDAADGLKADALRAQDWAGEPFLHPGEEPAEVLAPGTARRAALDEALAEIEAGRSDAVAALEGALRLPARARARALLEAAHDRRRHRAAQAPDRRARRDADRADRGEPAPGRGRERQRPRRRELELEAEEADEDDELDAGRGRTTRSPRTFVGEDPGAVRRYRFRHPTASGKTIAAAGFVEAARTLGILILTHRRLLVSQFQRDLTTEGYGDRFTDFIERGQGAAPRRPDHDPDLRLVRAPRRLALARGVPARDLRRGAHGARREDERGDPQLPGADLHRHDRDRAADREAGLGRLPRLGRRPAARRRRPPRPDRAAPLPARPARGGDQLGADRRRRLRGARPGRSPRPPGSEPGRGEPLPRALRHDARDRLRRRRRPRVQPRAGVPRRRAEGGGRSRAARRPSGSPRRSPPTSAARSTS